MLDELIRGVNDNILISRATHIINQLFLDITINDLIIMVMYRVIENGEYNLFIKI